MERPPGNLLAPSSYSNFLSRRLLRPLWLSMTARGLQPTFVHLGAGRSSEVERSLMVRWVVGSILHGVDPLIYFSFQPVLHDWCNKGRGMCYPVCGMVHIKEPLLLIDKRMWRQRVSFLAIRMVLNHMSDAI